ncbi:MAG: Xaa-Pro aminopeptidase [Pseudonocardiales bacterium]|nr:Xaa-Pro aminopeptidase [Pseudonocardiales bacterium]
MTREMTLAESLERRQAWDVTSATMADRGVRGAVVSFGGEPRACGDISWLLTSLPTTRPQWLWLRPAEAPTVVVGREADRAHLRDAGVDYDVLVVPPVDWSDALRRLSSGIAPEDIGYSGTFDFSSSAAPLGPKDNPQTDLATAFRNERIPKSEWRIQQLVTLGELIDSALEETVSYVAMGTTPRDLVAAAQQALIRRGAVHTLVYASAGPFFSSPPRENPLRDGDTVSIYLEAGDRYGHWLEAVECLSAGPGDRRSPLARTARACEHAVEVELGRGNAGHGAVSAAETAAGTLAPSLHWSHSVLHGVGLGDREALPNRLSLGATVAVHTSVSDGQSGATFGASYLTTDDGLRRLCGERPNQLGEKP